MRSRFGSTISRRAHGMPVWHGGMLESGIGRAHNIHLSTLPNFSLPGDVAASRRYYAPDLIDPEIEVRPDGTIAVPTGPGIGVQRRRGSRRRRDPGEAGARTADHGDDVATTRIPDRAPADARALAACGTLRAAARCVQHAAGARRHRAVDQFEQKMAWILQLEDQRILRVPAPPAPPPPPPVETARKGKVAAAPPAPPAPPDLTALVKDSEPRIRRRAALAIGRVGLPEGIAAAHRRARPTPIPSAADGRVRAGADRRRRPPNRRWRRCSPTPLRWCAAAPPKRSA